MQNPLVSIIITTKNEADVIKGLLKSIKKQSYKKLEIIVVDNNSEDKTKGISRSFTKKIYDKGPERSAQRNFGVKQALGRYLLFLDADMELSSKVVEECVYKMESNVSMGALMIPEKPIAKRFWEKIKAFERSFYNLEGDDVTDAARFFNKEIFYKIGGYDEMLTGPEDWELTERVKKGKFLIGRVNALIYHYERISDIYSLLKKKYYYGIKSNIYFKKKNIPLFGPKTIYFLRPVFYKHWSRMVMHPFLTSAMFFMLGLEMVAGGLGYLKGKYYE